MPPGYRFVITAILVVGLCLGAAGPALAQQTPTATPSGTTTTNGTPGGTTAATTTGTGNSSGSGGGWLPDFPDPGQMAADVIESGLNAFMDAVSGLVDGFNWLMVSLPAPGDAQDPTTWYPGFTTTVEGEAGGRSTPDMTSDDSTNPQLERLKPTAPAVNESANGSANNSSGGPINLDGWWEATWGIYAGLAAIFGLPVVVSGVIAWTRSDITGREKSQRLREVGKALGMIVAGPLLIPLALHIGNLFAIGVAPSGTEFFATPGNAAKLGIGLAVAIPLLAIETGVILISLLILFAQWLAVFFVCASWPIFAAAVASNSQYAQPLGTLGVTSLLILIALKALQAIWLRFLFELPLDWTNPASLLTLLAIIVGLAIGFIGLPIKGTEKALPQTVTSAGRETRNRAPDREEVQSVINRRYGDDEDEDDDN